jgi:asparagine synthase (glutamine-hydrolysing)
MCGIVGLCNFNGEPVDAAILAAMTARLVHRGPDGSGEWVSGAVGLGHRRLAIIDLSDAARQPMKNETGSLLLTFNGEIYNFQPLRAELSALGHSFRSRTDSEVVLHAYEEWGPGCVDRLRGMFAFAIWDQDEGSLFLARDRFGVKPLYWYQDDRMFAFASEVKALLAHPFIPARLSYPALNEYFSFQNIFSDQTLFEGVRLLAAGTTLTVRDVRGAGRVQMQRYWDFTPPGDPLELGEPEAADQLYELFENAVQRQLISDVPVGAYLSGGMDSGSIVSVAARHIPRLTTFTAGFDLGSASGIELAFDERREAELMASHFKAEHYQVVLHAGDMEYVLPQLIWHLEDLRVGQSYPNYYAARLASRFVKVVLSGAGGDELFGGYPWRYLRGAFSAGREEYFRNYHEFWQRLVPESDKRRFFNEQSWRELGGHSSFDEFRNVYAGWPGGFDSPEERVNASLYFELKTFLHALLVVEDKISMAHSLETRVPFLDEDLVAFALRLPVAHKLALLNGQAAAPARPIDAQGERRTAAGKAVLRTAMRRLIPRTIADREKQGFSAPDASWFRGESIDYIRRLLCGRDAAIYEFLNPDYVRGVIDEHCSGRANHRLMIWSLLSFEWWCRSFLDMHDGSSRIEGGLAPAGQVTAWTS